MTTERPILFSAPMVRAILAGSKTQTRRLYKPREGSPYEIVGENDAGRPWPMWFNPNHGADYHPVLCPHGNVGDRLWVKETWSAPPAYDRQKPTELSELTPIRYNSDGFVRGVSKRFIDADGLIAIGRLRPSIFMRRWMSRITLAITDVRVQRLQDISVEDALAEGIDRAPHQCPCEFCAKTSQMCPATATGVIEDFRALWDSINAERALWSSNPWVWALTFRMVEP